MRRSHCPHRHRRATRQSPRARHDHNIFTFGSRQNLQATGKLQHVVETVGTNHTALPQHGVVDFVIPRQGAGVRPGGPGAHGRASGFEHDDGFGLRHALRHLGKRPTVFQIFDVHGDDLRIGILLEERQQVVLVNV